MYRYERQMFWVITEMTSTIPKSNYLKEYIFLKWPICLRVYYID